MESKAGFNATAVVVGLGSWVSGVAYRVAAPVIIIGVAYGAYSSISQAPVSIPIFGQGAGGFSDRLNYDAVQYFDWIVRNWVGFGALVLLWNSVRSSIAVTRVDRISYMSLVALVTLADYLQVEAETDDMRSLKKFGPWGHQKAVWVTEALMYVLNIRSNPDAVSAKAMRNGVRASFHDDLARVARPNREAA
jgi:hypothetical protein